MIEWFATPPTMRPPEVRTLEQLCEHFRTNIAEIAGFTAEEGFVARVMNCPLPWQKATTDVMKAIYNNAIDSSRKDQAKWVAMYMRLVRHPLQHTLDDFVSD